MGLKRFYLCVQKSAKEALRPTKRSPLAIRLCVGIEPRPDATVLFQIVDDNDIPIVEGAVVEQRRNSLSWMRPGDDQVLFKRGRIEIRGEQVEVVVMNDEFADIVVHETI